MTPEQKAAVERVPCVKCGVSAGEECIVVSVDISEITGHKIVTIPIEFVEYRNPHPIRMITYRREIDTITRMGDLGRET